tara:strand:+ start:3559 stop:4125 length:567 start_codon:yes stop_codon:yes gene_type:complete
MSTNVLDEPPKKFHAGETLCFDFSALDYSAGASWELSWYLKGDSQSSWAWGSEVAANGNAFRTTVSAATTAAIGAGKYWLKGVVEKAGEKHLVYDGSMVVSPDPTLVDGSYDERSHAEKVVEALESVIEGRATRSEASYSFSGPISRTIEFSPMEDLIKARNRYRREVNNEKRAKGEGRSRVRRTRFV